MRTASAGRTRRIDAAKKALGEVLSTLTPETNVGVLALNSTVNQSNWIVPLGPADPNRWRTSIDRIQAHGGTPLGAFLKIGGDALLEARAEQGYGTYRLLVVTDGEANDSHLVEAYLPIILRRGLIVDVIGVDMNAEHSLAARAHSYRSANNDQTLKEAISAVFAETSLDDENAEEDFDLIAGLPDGFAEAALQALAHQTNEPIGDAEDDGSTTSHWSISGSSGTTTSGAFSLFGGLLCCFGTFVGLALLITLLIKVVSGPRRRR